MAAQIIKPTWAILWSVWMGSLVASLFLKHIWWMRLTWLAFIILEGIATALSNKITLSDGTQIHKGDTLSEVSAHVSSMGKPATRKYWWRGWQAAVSLVELPLICLHFYLTLSWGPLGILQFWWLSIIPVVGLYMWLFYHFLQVTRYG